MPGSLLIISHEAPGANMAGPAIRYWNMAQTLADEFEVTLAAPGSVELPPGKVKVVGYDRAEGKDLLGPALNSQVILVSGFALHHYPFLSRLRLPLVVDLYDPFVLENLAIHVDKPIAEQAAINRVNHGVLLEQLTRGDFFLCASERQRDFWLGLLAAAGRVNPYTFAADPTLHRLIDVVPFGVPDDPPRAARPALRGVFPGIEAGDEVVYWGGGLWDWFDPLTTIRAVALLAAQRPRLRLFFAGVSHPNPAVPPMRPAAAAQRLSAELGLTGRHVFFNSWVPYAERAGYLLEADIGLSLHLDQIEARFAYRTRLLDYIWAGLPIVTTRGDSLGEQLAALELATVVAAGDVSGVVEALTGWLNENGEQRAARRMRAAAMADEMRWSRIVGPLREYCRAPSVAVDRLRVRSTPVWHPHLAAKVWKSLRRQGPAGLWRDIRLYLNW